MSIAAQISRIFGLRNAIRTKLNSLGLLTPEGGTPSRSQSVVGDDLEACAQAIELIDGTEYIRDLNTHDVTDKQFVQVDDDNLSAGNIKTDVTILGVTGNLSPNPLTQDNCVVIYGAENAQDTMTPPNGYSGFPGVSFSLASQPERTLLPENIKKGVQIMGVHGSYGPPFEYTTGDIHVYDGGKSLKFTIGWGSGFPPSPYYGGECINHGTYVSPKKYYYDVRYASLALDLVISQGGTSYLWGPQDNYRVIGVELGWDFHKVMPTTNAYSAYRYMVIDVIRKMTVGPIRIYRLVCGQDSSYSLTWDKNASSNGKFELEIKLGNSFFYADDKNNPLDSFGTAGDDVAFLVPTETMYASQIHIIW